MKNAFTLLILSCFACLAAPVRQYDTVAAMLAQKPIAGETVLTDGPGGLRSWKHVSSITGTTNTGNKFAAVGGGYLEALDKDAPTQDPRWFGAVGDGVTDDTAAIDAAILAASDLNTNGPSKVLFPPGKYRITDTITLTSGRLEIVGSVGYSSVFKSSRIVMDATNRPIFSLSGYRYKMDGLSLEFENMASTNDVESICLKLNGVHISEFSNITLRKGAYGIKDTAYTVNSTFRNILASSFSRSGIRFDAIGTPCVLENIYVQNASDGLDTSLVNITAASVTSGTNFSFTVDQVPTRLTTNMFVTVAGLSPAGMNGIMVVAGISGNTITGSYASAPGTVTDQEGTLELTARYCAEAPFQCGYGWPTITGLDIEHCIVDAAYAASFRGELNSVTDLHLEQIYPLQSPFYVIDTFSASTANFGQVSMINSGFQAGTTNYLFRLAYPYARPGVGGNVVLGGGRIRDVAKSGALFYPASRASYTHPDLVLLSGIDTGGTARVNADGEFTDATIGMSAAVTSKRGPFTDSTAGGTGIGIYPSIVFATNSAAGYAAITVQPTNADYSIGSGGVYSIIQRDILGTNRVLLGEGTLALTATNQAQSSFGGPTTSYGKISFLYGQPASSSRLVVGNNYMSWADQVTGNPVGAAMYADYLSLFNGSTPMVKFSTNGVSATSTPIEIYDGVGLKRIGVTNINGAAVLYLIGVAP